MVSVFPVMGGFHWSGFEICSWQKSLRSPFRPFPPLAYTSLFCVCVLQEWRTVSGLFRKTSRTFQHPVSKPSVCRERDPHWRLEAVESVEFTGAFTDAAPLECNYDNYEFSPPASPISLRVADREGKIRIDVCGCRDLRLLQAVQCNDWLHISSAHSVRGLLSWPQHRICQLQACRMLVPTIRID